jgi:hypothetical protein
MRCPLCKSQKIYTPNSRAKPDINGVKRQKKCRHCDHKWNTIELHQDTLTYFEGLQQKLQEYEQKLNSSRRGWSTVWTPSEDDLLIELYYAGARYRDIAARLKRTYKGIEMRIIKLREAGKL